MDQIAEIKQKLDIVDVIGSYVSLKKSGRNYKACCPFHAEKTPSFMVSQELQIFKCFGCGASGDIYKFVQDIEGIDFPQALEILAEKADIKLEKIEFVDKEANLKKNIYKINGLTTQFYHYILTKHKAGKIALEYLKNERKISIDAVNHFNLGYSPDTWDSLYKFLRNKKINEVEATTAGVISRKKSGVGYIDKYRSRIIFPLTGIGDKVVGFTARTIKNEEPKYINSAENPVFHKSNFVYGLNENRLAIKQEGIVFVEGPFDVINAWQNGIKNVVCSLGTALTEGHLRLLSRYSKDVTFCFDPDTAGISAAYKAVSLAEQLDFNIKMVLVPQGFSDLDALLKDDPQRAKKMLKDAIPAYDYFLITQLKKHDKKTATGKKRIIEELSPLFSKISNSVLLSHYTKKIAEELDIKEEVVSEMLLKPELIRNSRHITEEKSDLAKQFTHDPESYYMALLLQSPIEIAQKYSAKTAVKDFSQDLLGLIFSSFRHYIEERKSDTNINTLLKDIDETHHEMVKNLYLWDFDFPGGEDLEDELISSLKRIKKYSAKRQLHDYSEEMKIAETENNFEKIEELSKKIERLSKTLI